METEISVSKLENIKEVAILFPDYETLRSGIAQQLYDRERVVPRIF